MGLAKIVNVLGKFVASKGGKLGTVLERNSGKLEKIEVFSKDYLKKNKKQLAATFLTGLTVGGCTFKGCSSKEEQVSQQEKQPAKSEPAEYYGFGYANNDTIVFKSESDAENFTKLWSQYQKGAVDRIKSFEKPYYDAIGSKSWESHRVVNDQIDAEYNKQKKPLETVRDKKYHEADSIRDAQREAALHEFNANLAPIDSVKIAKKKKNDEKFASSPEGKAINTYYEVERETNERLWQQFQILLDAFNGNRKH